MHPLPEDFLNQLASKYELSPEQKQAFVQRFSIKGNELDAAESLHISPEAFRTRMTGVYRKFSIGGEGPGKYYKLHNFLIGEYEKVHPSAIDETLKSDKDIDALVQEIREKVKPLIQEHCGTMRVLDMAQPIGLNDIYTDVNILETITGRRRKSIFDLLLNFFQKLTRRLGEIPPNATVSEQLKLFNPESDNFDRIGLSEVSEERVPGLTAVSSYPKLMVLGKPGAGKTTFLKYLAIQCIYNNFKENLVPIFIPLKQLSETHSQGILADYLVQHFARHGITDIQTWKLINDGRMLLLLDGLDEVIEEDSSRVVSLVEEFSKQYYTNQLVVTCRIAAREYIFEQFVEVEVADFDEQQITEFSTKWFQAKDPIKGDKFITKLKENEPIKELATNPLLLTLLCLVFEESAQFPLNRSELYKEGLDVLLKKWDVKRNIERDQTYKKLSLRRKEDLLSKVAVNTFEEGNYFFKQKEVERHIIDYIRNIPDVGTDLEILQLDSEAILKSIEAQHGLLVERARGIYSFSHLTFQEYFVANAIVTSSNPYAFDDKALTNLVSHVTEKRWWEVFLLVVGMLQSADCLLQLMKDSINTALALDTKMQKFLTWVDQKSFSMETLYKPAAVRAFYFTIGLDHTYDPNFELASALDLGFDPNNDLTCDHTLVLLLSSALSLKIDSRVDSTAELEFDPDNDVSNMRSYKLASALLGHDPDIVKALDISIPPEIINKFERVFNDNFERTDLNCAFVPGLQPALQKLKKQIPNSWLGDVTHLEWWQENQRNWTGQLRTIMTEYRDIGHNWQFSDEQKKLLKRYYDTNRLLVDCLNSDCYVSREVRQEIEDTLFLPMAKIKKRKDELS